MKKISDVLVLTISLCALFLSCSLACSFDTDCQPGSKCVKKSGSIYGACVGGLYPGNANDDKPVYAPMDLNKTYGDTCSFDTDCGSGSVCVKSGSIYGTCMKRDNSVNMALPQFQDDNAQSRNSGMRCVKYPKGYPVPVRGGMITYSDGTVCYPDN